MPAAFPPDPGGELAENRAAGPSRPPLTAPGRDRWCHHVETAVATLECGGAQHRILWRRGKLVLEDHDLGAEQAMLGFGGEMPVCLRTLVLWRNLHSWAMSAELLDQMQHRLGTEALFGPGDLARVHQLGLVLTWERSWRRRSYLTSHGRLLQGVLRDRALAPFREHLRHWTQRRGSRRVSSATIEVARSGVPGVVTGDMDSVGVRATATLGARWLVTVWARDLAVVDGAFVLSVESESPPGRPHALAVLAVRWDDDPERPGSWVPVIAPAWVEADAEGVRRLAWAS